MQNVKSSVCCFLCRKKQNADSVKLRSIEKSQAPSKKSIKAIIMHLAKFMKTEVYVSSTASVCQVCFRDLVEYDEFVLKLLASQQRLTQMIEKSLCSGSECPTESEAEASSLDPLTSIAEEEESQSHLLNVLTNISEDLCGDPDLDSMDEEEISMPDVELDGEDMDIELNDVIKTTPAKAQVAACAHCNKVFKNKTRLKYHNDHDHKRMDACTCTVCGLTVRDEEYLELHMNVHEGKSENECRYCSKRYTRRVNVIRHMQKHWDKKKFQCEKCGLRFSETTVLYNHKLQHEAEEEPLICNVCKQSFKTKRTYKGHILTHRLDRPRYSCQYCAKTFVEKYTLKVHLRVHEAEGEGVEKRNLSKDECQDEDKAVFKCIICGCSFTAKEHYNQHMEKEHDVILKT